ncbi:endo-1 family protein [Dorcoceras hygrometricum]|uniref:Endo-1 family protein n=1 Tax=Dorcoceras hygrometricum TaxID=472368 RepID=A0A2Z7DEF2_9LAMI|nr:endo-1 family protein [Dorcoceras hygrometricum]
MSTTELNSNGENDKKPAKEKDTSTVPLAILYRTILNEKKLCPTGRNLNRGLYTSRAPLKKKNEKTGRVPVQARRRKTHVYVVSHTVEAVVHLWSLGVLTAAGCGIGSVHAVVRSNLLVEPSEVEEGEM